MARARRTRKKDRVIPSAGVAHISASFNNTIITITDFDGNTVCWASPGRIGFKGSKKGTPFAAGQSAKNCAKAAMDLGVRKVEVWVKGCFVCSLTPQIQDT